MTVTGMGSAKSRDQVEAALAARLESVEQARRPAPRCGAQRPHVARGEHVVNDLLDAGVVGRLDLEQRAGLDRVEGGVGGVRGRPLGHGVRWWMTRPSRRSRSRASTSRWRVTIHFPQPSYQAIGASARSRA
jgi:hypothetical protein